MTDHETAVAIVEGDKQRAAAQADMDARVLEIKRRQSLRLTIAVCVALVAVVFGVVIPVALDKSDSDERKADLDTIAANTSKTDTVVNQVQQVLDQQARDNSPESKALLVQAVQQLAGVIKCDGLANQDALLAELERRDLIPTGSVLACEPPPEFTYPPETTTTVPGG